MKRRTNARDRYDNAEYRDPDEKKLIANPPQRRMITRTMTAPERIAEQQKKMAAEKRIKQQVQDAYDEEVRNRPLGAPGQRNDGQFHIAFIDVGLGDCTILTTPGGKTILIDCGSDSLSKDDKDNYVEAEDVFRKRVRDTIYGPKFLGGPIKTLDMLILTHSDQDHWNLLEHVLKNETAIAKCYHSGRLDQGYKKTGTLVREHGCKLFQAVTLSEEGYALMNGEPLPLERSTRKVDVISRVRCDIKILDEPNCTISILSSNVYKEGARGVHDFLDLQLTSNSTAPNRGSLVVLVEVFDKKLLICGDATIATEEFIMLQYAPWIKNLDVLRLAHHGSETSSDESFISYVAPKKCIISAGRNIKVHRLPKRSIVERVLQYLPKAVANAPLHSLCGWGNAGDYKINIIKTGQELYITGMNGTQEITYANPSVIISSTKKK